ncbi:MAG: protein-export chaperone SecB [Kiloniellaceae bacterium]
MAEEAAQPQLTINTQYVKDHSFENPNAPTIYGSMRTGKPDINVSIEVTPTQLQDSIYEVVLALRAEAKIGDTPAFLAELDYAAVVSLGPDVTEQMREQLVMIEVPRHLFPFARAILADDTRDGGFPPLMMGPVDFAQLYLSRKVAAGAAQKEGEGEAKAEGSNGANGQA